VDAVGAIDRLEIEANGLRFTARACGPHDGRRVLLLHGFPQTSWAWRDELWALGAAGCRAIAPDLRGYCSGARPSDPDAYAMPHLLDDVIRLADAMEMGVFDLVGHDFGAMLAWLVASRLPDRIRSLSVISTPHPMALQSALLGNDRRQSSWVEAMETYLEPELPERLLLGPDGSGSGLARLLTETGLDDEDAAVYVAALTEPGAMTAALNWYRAMNRDVLVDLRPVTVPTLYVWSTGDDAFSRAAAEATGECVVGLYTFEVLPNVSHWVPEMAPVELSLLLVRHLSET